MTRMHVRGRLVTKGWSRLKVRYGFFGAMALCMAAGVVSAAVPEHEYKDLIKINDSIQPLGDAPFGARINRYTGELSFFTIDAQLAGTGPLLRLGREMHPGELTEPTMYQPPGFGDWNIAIPRLVTRVPGDMKWQIMRLGQIKDTRCSEFASPSAALNRWGPFRDADWFTGMQLVTEDGIARELLERHPDNHLAPTDANGVSLESSHGAVTTDNWQFGCLPSTKNGQPGEGFLGMAPDGTRYWFDWLVFDSRRTSVQTTMGTPQTFTLPVYRAAMLVTRIEDRFGNYLNYSYDGDRLTRIDGSDGRSLSFAWNADQTIASMTLGSGNAIRTWEYAYTTKVISPARTDHYLTTMKQPDGMAYGFDLSSFANAMVGDIQPDVSTCDIGVEGRISHSDMWGKHFMGRISGPSGLIESYDITLTKHGRANVPRVCYPNEYNTPWYAAAPAEFYTQSIVARTQEGTGTRLAWSYQHGTPHASWAGQCGDAICASNTVTEVRPDGASDRYTFSIAWGETEGQLQRVDYNAGGSPSRSVVTTYASAAQGPYPVRFGYDPSPGSMNDARITRITPVSGQSILQDGDTYQAVVDEFDEFAQPVRTRRFSSMSPQTVSSERSVWLNDKVRWIIGLPVQTDELGTGHVISRREYDPSSLTLSARYDFGRLSMRYAYDANGNLASFTNPKGGVTTLGDYMRGIPRHIVFPATAGAPAGAEQSIAVDEVGNVTAIRNERGELTQYAYDPMNRLTHVVYPAYMGMPWNDRFISYEWVAAGRGIPSAHLRRTEREGQATAHTDYDAWFRPVLEDKMALDGTLASSRGHAYDWRGQTTFDSYAMAGTPDLGAMNEGVWTDHDGLGRLSATRSTSEQGILTTKTEYLSGARVANTDARQARTVTTYQVFDQPDYGRPLRIDAPEGLSQSIERDIYGKPLSVTQSGGGLSLTKWWFYDASQRLCRTREPESGNTVADYDDNGNVIWTAVGQIDPVNDVQCGRSDALAEDKVGREYDARDRLLTVNYADGSPGQAFTYDAAGDVTHSASGDIAWDFERNSRGALTSETLSVDSHRWSFGYGYDASGHPSGITYPDGQGLSFDVDALGRARRVESFATGITYHPDGTLQAMTLGNGVSFNAQQNARHLVANASYGTASQLAISQDIRYDANGNPLTITDLATTGQRTKTFGYDGLDRLVSAKSSLWGDESYAYDALNNIAAIVLNGSQRTYSYDSANRLQSIASGTAITTFAYDKRGNATAKDAVPRRFDLGNRLVDTMGQSMRYDAAGRRVKLSRGTKDTYYAYTANGRLMWEYDPATETGKDYVYAANKLVARMDTQKLSDQPPVLSGPSSVGLGETIHLTWTAVTGAEYYEVLELTPGGEAILAYKGAGRSVDRVHQDAGTYRYQVQACRGDSCKRSSEPFPVIVRAPPAAPAAPASVSASASADLFIVTVHWSESPDASRYEVQVSYQWNASVDLYKGPALTTQHYTASDGFYIYQVRACNDVGCSAWVASPRVDEKHHPVVPANVSAPASSGASVGISWNTSAYAVKYEVEVSRNGGAFTAFATVNAPAVTYVASDSGTYAFRVRACNDVQCSDYGPVATSAVRVAPKFAPNVSVPSASASDSYTVSWTGVSDADNYLVQEQVNGGGWGTLQQLASGALAIQGRGTGVYGYRVQACNTGGCGPFSGVASVTVSLIPAVPTVTAYTRNSPRFISLIISLSPVPGATWYESNDVDPNANPNGIIVNRGGATEYEADSLDISELPFQGRHRVRSCNSQGCSDWSEWKR
ncbi:MAG: tRNA(Glu)-specific nuclease WapA [Luteibacter sp.]|uniref:hypothetical protein n=1 Tax=Luteibacter sp. TaxID=1886636 RepID=UPI0013861D9E|nr:hypothetical protein [Luteibacter sp.]KAF1007658.1 MAG: tRNA(Glu)-specific nuclease WapA [Luteibacter sp.]